MRLSVWRAHAPHKDAANAKLAVVVDSVLRAFGTEADPHCWVVWGDDPGVRYVILVPTEPGLIHCFVRVNIPGEGPRVSTKLIRWNRVAIGELALEMQSGHRLLSFQVEGQVLRGVDDEADHAAAFALRVIAAVDGRPLPPVEEPVPRRGSMRPRAAADRASVKRAGGATSPGKTARGGSSGTSRRAAAAR